jgi:hypothetical protein
MAKINKAIAFREAADRVWELSHQYNDTQIINLLRDLASELHTEARKHEEIDQSKIISLYLIKDDFNL